MTREAWARGRNYDVDLLTFSTATPGFILGEAVIGESLLGDRGTDVEVDMDFTSITVSEPTTVEDGLFVHREVSFCNITATLPSLLTLRGRWVRVAYDGSDLFEGRVSRAEWTETVSVGEDYQPGNNDSKTYRLQLTATTGEEVLATAAARITGSNTIPESVSLIQRVQNLTGYTVDVFGAAEDLPLATWNQDWGTDFGGTEAAWLLYDNDNPMKLLDALRREARAGGFTVRYSPRASSQVALFPVNRWLVGDTESEALVFTDEVIDSPATNPGDEFLTADRRVSYSARQISEDPAMFTDSAKVLFQIRTDTPGEFIESTHGPYRANDAAPQDQAVDYGQIAFNGALGDQPYRLARAIAQTLPLKRSPQPFPSAVATPMQSVQQIEGVVPGMALMTSDGVTQRVAVLARTHSITPDKWLVSYQLGPEHLLTRTSDREPAPALVQAPVVAAGVSTTFRWTVPDLPSDVTWFEVVFKGSTSVDGVSLYTSTATSYPPARVEPAPAAGTARTYVKTGGTPGDYWYVAYTTNSEPSTGASSDVWREGQPAILGQQTH